MDVFLCPTRDTTKTSDSSNYQAASDQGGVGGSAVDTIPWFLTLEYPWGGEGMLHNPSTYDLTRGTLSTTATANATTDDHEKDLSQGTTTDVNGVTNTNETFDDTGGGDYTDGNWQSTTGGYNDSTGSGDYKAIYSSSDNGSETDTSNGTMNGGVTSDNYFESGGATASSSYSISYSTTSSSSDTTAHNQLITSSDRHDVGGMTESGDYTTEPAGTTLTGTTDNPNGYAISDQTIVYSRTIINNRSEGYAADLATPNYYVSGGGNTTASGTLTASSNSTVNVNVAQTKDVQSGDWSWGISQTQVSGYTENATYDVPGSSTSAKWSTVYGVNQAGENGAFGTYGGPSDKQAPVDGSAGGACDMGLMCVPDPGATVQPNGFGHHYFPQALADRLAESGELTVEAYRAAKGAGSGPTKPAHRGYPQAHRDYDAAVTAEWNRYAAENHISADNPATSAQMQDFIDAKILSSEDARIKSYLATVEQRATDYKTGTGQPTDMPVESKAQRLKRWIAQGEAFIKSRAGQGSRLASMLEAAAKPIKGAGLAVGSAALGQAIGGIAEAAGEDSYYRRGLAALNAGDLSGGMKLLLGTVRGGTEGFYDQLLASGNEGAALDFQRWLEMAENDVLHGDGIFGDNKPRHDPSAAPPAPLPGPPGFWELYWYYRWW